MGVCGANIIGSRNAGPLVLMSDSCSWYGEETSSLNQLVITSRIIFHIVLARRSKVE